MATNLLSIEDVCKLINRNRRTLWEWVRDGKFPQPIKINGRTLGWKESTYNEWIENIDKEIIQ